MQSYADTWAPKEVREVGLSADGAQHHDSCVDSIHIPKNEELQMKKKKTKVN